MLLNIKQLFASKFPFKNGCRLTCTCHLIASLIYAHATVKILAVAFGNTQSVSKSRRHIQNEKTLSNEWLNSFNCVECEKEYYFFFNSINKLEIGVSRLWMLIHIKDSHYEMADGLPLARITFTCVFRKADNLHSHSHSLTHTYWAKRTRVEKVVLYNTI